MWHHDIQPARQQNNFPMELTHSLKRAICSLFEVHADEGDVQRIVTPLEYAGSGDKIVVRVRPAGQGFVIDENGDAALYANLNGGDTESDAVSRWVEELASGSPVTMGDSEELIAYTRDTSLVAPYIFRVAEAAQQLHAIATSRAERRGVSDFKDRLAEVIKDVAESMNVKASSSVELPIAGGLLADHVIDTATPLIVIAATNVTRLLEAEIIHMQYRLDQKPGFVLAVAESQVAVGRKQYERAGYYTDRTVIYNPQDLHRLLAAQIKSSQHQVH